MIYSIREFWFLINEAAHKVVGMCVLELFAFQVVIRGVKIKTLKLQAKI